MRAKREIVLNLEALVALAKQGRSCCWRSITIPSGIFIPEGLPDIPMAANGHCSCGSIPDPVEMETDGAPEAGVGGSGPDGGEGAAPLELGPLLGSKEEGSIGGGGPPLVAIFSLGGAVPSWRSAVREGGQSCAGT